MLRWEAVMTRRRVPNDMSYDMLAAELRRRGIHLTRAQIMAAMWWAGLTPEWRERLKRELSFARTPLELMKLSSVIFPELTK
jgi:hypothetical protein